MVRWIVDDCRARTAGVNNIIALDGNPGRLEIARRMGADELINYKEYSGIDEIIEKVKGLTKGWVLTGASR